MLRILPNPEPTFLRVGRMVSNLAGHRVELPVHGAPLWFESPDVALSPAIEAALAALLFSALQRGILISSDTPVDPVFNQGLQSLVQIYSQWWGYRPDVVPHLPTAERRTGATSSRVGLCFSGGVDSFYSLLAATDRVDALVFVHGFDISLDDARRWRHAEKAFRSVCSEYGKQPIVVRTNLREHAVFRRVPWNRAHGAALAAVGHALSDQIGTLIIPTSYQVDRLRPWGSDPRTDPLYSSSRLRIEHTPSMDGRVDRLRRIADNPLARRYLRVCYENRAPQGNCGSCEKCLSTMTTLHGLGKLDAFQVFDAHRSLDARLDRLPRIAHHTIAIWGEVAALDHHRHVAGALQRLFQRSNRRGWKSLLRRIGVG